MIIDDKRCRYLIRVMLLVVCFWARDPQPASAQSCEKSVSEIRYEFIAFRFQKVIDLALACLDSGKLSRTDRLQALELIVLAHFELGQYDEARPYLRTLFKLDPNYVIEPAEPTVETVRVIAEATMEARSENRKSRWPWLAVGAGVAGAVAAILVVSSSGGGEPPGFPKPPGRPQ